MEARPELANAQKPDIWIQHSQVSGPVPIELKLVDKEWSGPELCERLRNQLIGSYLRDTNAGCGIMLLIWQGKEAKKRWTIDGVRVDFAGLPEALEQHWQKHMNKFPTVDAIKVIGIDLTKRSKAAT